MSSSDDKGSAENAAERAERAAERAEEAEARAREIEEHIESHTSPPGDDGFGPGAGDTVDTNPDREPDELGPE